jgi:hypothetical protein
MVTRNQIGRLTVIEVCKQSRDTEEPLMSHADCLALLKLEIEKIRPAALYDEDLPFAIVLLAAGLLVGPDVDCMWALGTRARALRIPGGAQWG